ncbi:17453_t:CDS:1, partial [Gigaspora rosea]
KRYGEYYRRISRHTLEIQETKLVEEVKAYWAIAEKYFSEDSDEKIETIIWNDTEKGRSQLEINIENKI